MTIGPFRFNLQELGGALGDLGTLLPLATALILVNGLNATSVLVAIGLFYVISGLYFRIPTPVQPLKAVSAIAISLGLSGSVIGASSLIMGAILLVLSMTNLIGLVVRLFPKAVVRGIQLSIGLVLLRKGVELVFSQPALAEKASRFLNPSQLPVGVITAGLALLVFVLFQFVLPRQTRQFPSSLALLSFGLGVGLISTPTAAANAGVSPLPGLALPSSHDFWIALTVLVVPQLPLTLGNAVVGTWDTARTYFKDGARRVTPRALTTSMGIANIAAGLFGAMPMCHGSGGLTAHYKMGARTAGANLMIGGLLLAGGLLLGRSALPFLSFIPLSVLGVLLAIVGIYHTLLVRDVSTRMDLVVVAAVALIAVGWNNLAYGFAAGIALYYVITALLRRAEGRRRVAIQ